MFARVPQHVSKLKPKLTIQSLEKIKEGGLPTLPTEKWQPNPIMKLYRDHQIGKVPMAAGFSLLPLVFSLVN
jgi:hypothetical protein